MYLRFLASPRRRFRRGKIGFFHAVRVNCSALDWFNLNLRAPKKVDQRALFWFKEEAREMIERMYCFAAEMEWLGHTVEIRLSRNPGLIVFEDEHQIAAIPRSAIRQWPRV